MPLLFGCKLLEPTVDFPPLNKDERLVSSVIELTCDEQPDIHFTGQSKGEVVIALSHSAPKLEGYEVLIGELVSSDSSYEWKDLETTNIWQIPGKRFKMPNNLMLSLLPAILYDLQKNVIIYLPYTQTYPSTHQLHVLNHVLAYPVFPHTQPKNQLSFLSFHPPLRSSKLLEYLTKQHTNLPIYLSATCTCPCTQLSSFPAHLAKQPPLRLRAYLPVYPPIYLRTNSSIQGHQTLPVTRHAKLTH